MATRKKRPASRVKEPTAPLTESQLKRKVKPRRALKSSKRITVSHRIAFAQTGRETVFYEQVPSKMARPFGRKTARGEKLGKGAAIDIEVSTAQLGTHVFPAGFSGRKIPTPKLTKSRIEQAHMGLPALDGFAPDHLPIQPIPEKLPKELAVPRFMSGKPLVKGKDQATTVFPPENRYTFADTSFPWCTIGRVDTGGGWASGVLIGPRHLLTVSHAMVWGSGNTCGWVRFRPSYFDGSAPFGEAWATRWYAYRKVYGPSLSRAEMREDYVVLVLDRRIGDTCGWIGSRTYSDSWDGGRYWRHIGYPGDMAGGQRPSYERDIALDGSFWDAQSHQRIWHQGDVWPGQSGGPFFAWWSGESWPRVVSVQSAENSDENTSSGGSHMVDLIIRARNEYP